MEPQLLVLKRTADGYAMRHKEEVELISEDPKLANLFAITKGDTTIYSVHLYEINPSTRHFISGMRVNSDSLEIAKQFLAAYTSHGYQPVSLIDRSVGDTIIVVAKDFGLDLTARELSDRVELSDGRTTIVIKTLDNVLDGVKIPVVTLHDGLK